GAVGHRGTADPARRHAVGAQLRRVDAQPARAAAGCATVPLDAAQDLVADDRRHCPARRRRRPVLQGAQRMRGDSPDGPVHPDDTVIPDDPEDADPGLASERTALAWTRSSLAFAAVGVAIVKARPAVGIPILGLGLVVWLLGRLTRAQEGARA